MKESKDNTYKQECERLSIENKNLKIKREMARLA